MPGLVLHTRCTLLPRSRRVLVGGIEVPLGGRAFDLLLALALRRGSVVDRDELAEAVWPGVAVEPNNLAVQIWSLRRALGRDVVVTVARRGYQIAAWVEVVAREPRESVAPPPRDGAGAPAAASPAPLAGELAGWLVRGRWLTLAGGAPAQRRGLVDAICADYARLVDAVVWVRATVPARALRLEDGLLRRLRRVGALIALPEVGDAERANVFSWLRATDATEALRVLVTTPRAAGYPGERVHDLDAQRQRGEHVAT